MPIRIRCRDKWSDRRQVIEPAGFLAPLARIQRWLIRARECFPQLLRIHLIVVRMADTHR